MLIFHYSISLIIKVDIIAKILPTAIYSIGVFVYYVKIGAKALKGLVTKLTYP